MTSPYNIGIIGIQQAQHGNAQMMASFKPGGKFAKAVWRITKSLHRYAVTITHVITGSLRASHRMEMRDGGMTGFIWIDRTSRNPQTRAFPYRYGYYEEKRGGEHAFYARTLREAGDRTVAREIRGLYT